MKVTVLRAGAVIGGALMGLTVLTQQASAQQAPFPRFANFYDVWFARAMDACTPSGLTVVGAGLPSGGCIQTNVTTDSTLTMKFAKLSVNRRGRIGLLGVGFPFGARVKIELVLRATRAAQHVKHPPGSNKKVTFQDVTIDCPATPVGFVASQRGTIAGATTLAACLGSGLSGLADSVSNIEILDSSLINVDTGLVFAKPGIVR